MSIEGLIAAFVILALLAAWIAMPWLRGTRAERVDPVTRQRERLLVYYERVLRNIHDLDEDYATGKLNPDDYEAERELWARRGVEALKALDEIDSTHLIATAGLPAADLDERIEAAIETAVRASHENR